MTRLINCIVLLLLFAIPVMAQKNINGTVRGKVTDTASKQSLADATVSIIDTKDSSSVAFAAANDKGVFEIKGIEAGNYRMLITFQGYQNISKNFSITPDKQTIDFGTLFMEKRSVTLQEVIVERPPIAIKKDTVEYNASSFKTKANEDVEGLLKKLPGVQVDRDGTIKSQGEQVQKVYVDGKEFFGTDPKLATKNLTADMVESVQVFDDMSDQAKFTKIDDGSRQKAMNIKLKKDKKNGYFGKINAGAGTDGRYDGNLSFNRFKGDMQVSLIAAANNVNKQGFSFSDIISTMGGFGGGQGGGGQRGGGGGAFGGGGGGFGGGGIGGVQIVATRGAIGGLGFGGGSNGITSSLSTGLNYRDVWGPKIDVSGSYFFSQTKNNSVQNVYKQTNYFFNDSTALSNEDKVSQNQNDNHRFNMRFEYRIDSMNSILYTPSFNVQHSEGYSSDTTTVNSLQGGKQFLALVSKTFNDNSRDGISLNNNLLYRKRLRKTGRTLTIGWSNSYNHSDGEGNLYAPTTLFNRDGSVFSRKLSQNYHSDQITKSNNNVLSASYTEPVANNKLVELNYAYTNNQNTSDREAFDYDSLSGKYIIPNLQQTNFFENSFISNRIGANFRVQGKKYNYQLGGAVQLSSLESHVFANGSVKDSVIKQNYTNFNPTANFNFNPKLGTNLRFSYNGRTTQPTTSQLQNVIDKSNQLNWRTGNPNLKQSFSHNFNLGYNTFKLANFQFVAINFNGSFTQNKIVNSVDTVARGVQQTTPVNLDGAYNAFVFFTYGKTMKKLKGGNINATTMVNFNNDVSMLYKQKSINRMWTVTQSLGLNYNYKQIDFGFNGSLAYNNNRLNQPSQQNQVSQINTTYYTQTYSPEVTYTFFKTLLLSTDLDYTINSGLSAGYNQSVAYWNASVALQVFKKKDGEIKLAVYDILNQNQSLSRSVDGNNIIDTRSNVIQRYFMLSFTYNLRKGSQQNNNMQMIPRQFQRGMRNMRITN